MPDANAAADRNLLFGMLALQLDFISRDALVTAMEAWVFAKHKPLGQILQEQGALREDLRPLLDGLVEKHLQQHSGDPEKSLAALSSVASSVREQLGRIDDPDVQASRMHLGTGAGEAGDPFATRTGTVASAAPAGARFRILRPHARGGLGQVSVALDQELGREVALKEIQEKHADHPESRSRFLLEAEITGGLEHPGIVPVYALGTYGDGRPYYAMRFIRGDSLKEAVAHFHQADGKPRDPGDRALALRQLLGRFVDVCNALAYAHARGVLHRDLKPGNIMLGEYGETLVVDWGLAKPLGQPGADREKSLGPLLPPSASGTTLTQMGSAVGTPQYMSPEQSEGRLDELGPQSDVYSLGATLYTVLTGKPPVEGADVGEIMRKVQRGAIVPPRQFERGVPPALDAICLKAMALRPADRYPTARALAEDVEHWLADEPVSAYRDPWAARAARWARRHRQLVAGVSGLVLTALVALLVTTILVSREQARTEQQRRRAEANFATALQAVNDMLTQVAQEDLANEPRMEKKRRALLLRARDYYQQFLEQRGDDPRLRRETAQAYQRVGDITRLLGGYDDARTAYGHAIALFTPLADANPDDLDGRRALGDCYCYRGEAQRLTSHADEARADYQKALDREQPLADAHPERPEYRMDLARTWYNLGILTKDTHQYAEAETALTKSAGLLRDLVVAHKDEPLYRQHLARAYLNLGPVLRATQRPDQAQAAYLKAAGLQERLVEMDPSSPDYRYELGVTLNNLGWLQYSRGELAAAEESYRHALALYEPLAVQFPDVPVFRKELAYVRDNLGSVLAHTEREPAAEEVWRQARDGFHQLAAEHPDVPEYVGLEGMATGNLGWLRLALNEPRDARPLLVEGIGRLKKALEANPNNPTFLNALALDYTYLADA
ncbi:MAG TPA: protein kinase, partial [Gemmataceae bacterium]|nr:protein kinase [Gemmataceae bacterium]